MSALAAVLPPARLLRLLQLLLPCSPLWDKIDASNNGQNEMSIDKLNGVVPLPVAIIFHYFSVLCIRILCVYTYACTHNSLENI